MERSLLKILRLHLKKKKISDKNLPETESFEEDRIFKRKFNNAENLGESCHLLPTASVLAPGSWLPAPGSWILHPKRNFVGASVRFWFLYIRVPTLHLLAAQLKGASRMNVSGSRQPFWQMLMKPKSESFQSARNLRCYIHCHRITLEIY